MSESAAMSTKEARMGPFVLVTPVSARASATMSSQRKGKRFSRCLRKSLKKSAAEGKNFLAMFKADGKTSGVAAIGAVPNGGQQITTQEEEKDIGVVMAAYLAGKGVKNEKTV